MGKGEQVSMSYTDLAGMGDRSSGWVWVCVQVLGWVWVGVSKFWLIWAKVGKGGQIWLGQTDRAGMDDMANG